MSHAASLKIKKQTICLFQENKNENLIFFPVDIIMQCVLITCKEEFKFHEIRVCNKDSLTVRHYLSCVSSSRLGNIRTHVSLY